MKIAVITDIHHGPLSHTKDPDWNGLPAIRAFAERAQAEGADLILDLGDHISDTTHQADRQAMAEVVDAFAPFQGKRVHLLGNHDVANLSIEDNEEIFGQSMRSTVHDFGSVRLIAWQPDVFITRGIGFAEIGEQLDWLIDALEADERPAIIATHVPLSGHSQIGNYYFQRNPQYSTYPDHQRVRTAVEATGKAALWLAGHVHWNTVTNVGGVQHVTIQSLSERFTTAPRTAAAYADVTIDGDQFTVDVMGNDPFHVRLPFRRSGDRPWMTAMLPFDEVDPIIQQERLRA